MIPGDDLTLGEPELLQEVGKYIVLFQLEQRKRMALAQAYNELRQQLDKLNGTKSKKYSPDEVVVGNP